MKTSSQPVYAKQAAELMKTLRKLSASDLSKLMSLSDNLSELNAKRNLAWKAKHDDKNSRQAIFAFRGDVYQGFDVDTLSAAEVRRSDKHIRILSGLYGILRPLDLIQPYRLEMGTKLKTEHGSNLYQFWGDRVRDKILADLRTTKSDCIVNLASKEYSRAAKLKAIEAQVVVPAFREWRNGEYKMISFFAKQARGMMARHIVTEKVTAVDGLLDFEADGYRYNEKLSTELEPVFTRKSS
ncbi:peroxide stress protein YaaA [Stieleria marina]|uniref:UPF0246 protein K239x_55580 n=1 Tax=Stieleria marina TaxID=1930275 RepID=A0A517P2G5_9BACT|nr:hypothetical protein K239x_55580 [Planctomycetes bacterium K23_9]